MSNSLWFKHDFNARRDRKHLALRNEFGMEGYGLYWVIIELLAEEEEFCFPYDDDAIACISFESYVDAQRVKEYLKKAIEKKLFTVNDGYFYSESLNKRMEKLENRKRKYIEAGKLGAVARWEDNKSIVTPPPKTGRPKKKQNKYGKEDDEMIITNYLIDKILSISDTARVPKTDTAKQNWAATIDKLLRIDKRTPKQIHAVIEHAFKDPFWQTTILSADGLRKHFDKLQLQSKTKSYKPMEKPASHKILE